MNNSNKIKEVQAELEKEGYVLSKDAMEFLTENHNKIDDVKEIIKDSRNESLLKIITKEDILKNIQAQKNKERKKLNELDGKTWTKYSVSIWDITKSVHESRIKHPAMFPVELCKRLIKIFTKKGDLILDPFVGSGSVLVAAKELERKAVGIDINPDFVKLAKKRIAQDLLIETEVPKPQVFCDDAINLLDYVNPNSVDLVITSPPYWIVHKRKRTADYKESRPYSELERDLGNISDYHTFLQELKKIFEKVYAALKAEKYCVIVVMDIRIKSLFVPFHIDIINLMKEIGFILDDIIIWDRRKEYNNLRPLGYPYKFIVNKVHEYILLFRKTNLK